MKFQVACKDQAEEIVNVLIRSISELCHADHKNSDAILARWLRNKNIAQCRKWIDDSSRSMLVAIENGDIVAVGQVGKNGYLYLLYVKPENAGQGIGKKLLSELENLATRWGVGIIRLESTASARDFYEKQGYQLVKCGTAFGMMESFHMEKAIDISMPV